MTCLLHAIDETRKIAPYTPTLLSGLSCSVSGPRPAQSVWMGPSYVFSKRVQEEEEDSAVHGRIAYLPTPVVLPFSMVEAQHVLFPEELSREQSSNSSCCRAFRP